MEKTKIDWCDSTWNPVTGCLHGCEYCYARGIAERFRPFVLPRLTDEKQVHDLREAVATICKDGKERKCAYPYGFEPTFHRYRLNDYIAKKGRNIFVCSMADLFGDWVPDSWIEKVFAACEKAPQHRYLFLTKNPGRYADLTRKGIMPQGDNYWFGATYDHCNWSGKKVIGRPATWEFGGKTIHDAGDWYFPTHPEKNRFISFEPLLYDIGSRIGSTGGDWHIIGAETGKRKGRVECQPEWVHNIVKWSDEHGVPVFMKDSLIPIVGEENMRREFPW